MKPGRAPCFLAYNNPQLCEADTPISQLRKWRLIGIEGVTLLQRHGQKVGGLDSKN